MDASIGLLARARALAAGEAKGEVEVPHDIRLSRTDFSVFCKVMGKENARHHLEWVQEFVTEQTSSRLLRIAGPDTAILAPRGPLDLDTRVATPSGWRALRNVKAGDTVFAVDGSRTQVLATVNYGVEQCYRVTFSDGTSVVCDDSHRFTVRRMGTDKKGQWRVVTLQEIRRFVTVGSSGNWRTGVSRTVRLSEEGETPWLDGRGYPRYQIPVAGPVDYPEADLPLDPYVLGVLIGDGALTTGSPRFHKDDPDLVERVCDSLPEGYVVNPCGAKRGSWIISHVDGKRHKRDFGGKSNKVRLALEELGLWGVKSVDKFIPRCYLQASVEQRLALLQGLLDTDGQCAKKTGRGGVVFGSSSLQLITDITELARSLGALVFMLRPYQSSYRKADGTQVMCAMAYRVSFRFPEGFQPFHSHVKADLYQGPASARSNGGFVRSIVGIEPVGEREIGCISIEHPSELFIADQFIVCNNSAKSTVLALLTAWVIGIHCEAHQLIRILYISYALDIARSKSFQIKQIINSKQYREVFPMVRLGKDRTSDELWAVDMEFADVRVDADDPYTLCASGLGGAIVSRRADLIVVDDAIKSVDSISNPDIRAKLITNWMQVVRPCLLDGGRCIALGTRFSAVDIYGTTFTEKNGWRVVVEKAILSGDDGLEYSYWPDFWSLAYLQKLRRESPTDFSFQFQNLPVAQSELNFSEDLFVTAPLARDSSGEVAPYDMLCVGVDLSSGLKERNDYTVMLLGGIRDDKVEMISYMRMRSMGNLEKLDDLLHMLEEQGLVRLEVAGDEEKWFPTDCPVTIFFEEISYQQSIRGDAKTILHDKHGLHNIVLRGVKGYRGDKLSRFRGILGLFETGRITWNATYKWDTFKDEMVNFGYTDHDDCVDATVLAVRGLVGQGSLQADWADWDPER